MANTLIQPDAPPTRRVRKSTPKVRSGCITCKSRRVKCDEQRPACNRCIRANRKCEGYPTPRLNSTSTSGITAYSIPFKIPGSQSERQLLHYYCCHASYTLSAYTHPTLWTELILQRSHHEPVIRNALLALSSLHKDYLCDDFQPASGGDGELRSMPPPANTMSMIAKCHRQLRNYLFRNDASPQVALICSLIFYTFESLLGDSQKAIWHLDRGLMLLKRCHLDRDGQDDALIVHLTTLLHNLDIQASAFDDRRVPILDLVSDTESKGVVDLVPDFFSDISHAEKILTKLQNWTLHHLIAQGCHQGGTSDDRPVDVLRERLVLAAQFDRFAIALTDLMAAEEVEAATKNEAQARMRTQQLLHCRIHFHSFQYLLGDYLSNLTSALVPRTDVAGPSSASPPRSNHANGQRILKTTLSSIAALLSLSEQCSASSPSSSPSSSPRTYTLSTNLIAALYFVSLKTTDPQTLTSALALFSHPSIAQLRDGLWDARTAAFVVRNLLKLRPNGGHHYHDHRHRQHHDDDDHHHQYDGDDHYYHRQHHDDHDVHHAVPTTYTTLTYTAPSLADAAAIEKIQNMSTQHNLPMMQSRRLTVVIRTPEHDDPLTTETLRLANTSATRTTSTTNTTRTTNTPSFTSTTSTTTAAASTATTATTTARGNDDNDLLLLPPYLPSFMPPFLPTQPKTAPLLDTSSSALPFSWSDRDSRRMNTLKESWPPVSNCRDPKISRLQHLGPGIVDA